MNGTNFELIEDARTLAQDTISPVERAAKAPIDLSTTERTDESCSEAHDYVSSKATRKRAISFASALLPFAMKALSEFWIAVPPTLLFRVDKLALQDDFLEDLLRRLLALTDRTLVLELNIARLEERLPGVTPQDRFESFVLGLQERGGWQPILAEYPLLRANIERVSAQWVTSTREMFLHLQSHWEQLRPMLLAPLAAPSLSGCARGLSDPHRDGHSVAKLIFVDDEDTTKKVSIVYKPRSIKVEGQFQLLLDWCNQKFAQEEVGTPFRLLRLVNGRDCGFVECVDHRSCESVAEVERFYQRQGQLLALLHLVGGADFHEENLIAYGEFPMYVDLEALFHHSVEYPNDASGTYRAVRFLNESVMRLSLLPERIWGNDTNSGVYISGLGVATEQMSPDQWPVWEARGTDEMQQVKRRFLMPTRENVPLLGGVPIKAGEYLESLLDGFERLCRLILIHRSEFLSKRGPLMAFADIEVRQLQRQTMIYARILKDSLHPDVLRNDRALEELLNALDVLSERSPALQKLVNSEKNDLRRHDVPIFLSTPSSRHLWDSHGHVVRDYFSSSGLSIAIDKIKTLTTDAVARQVWLIQCSMAATRVGHADVVRDEGSPIAEHDPLRCAGSWSTILREDFLRCAILIGDRLLKTAFYGERDAAWLSFSATDHDNWSVRVAGSNLYDGVGGIALFLAYLSRLTGEPRFIDATRRAALTLTRLMEKGFDSGVGGYCGSTSQIYALSHLAGFVNPFDSDVAITRVLNDIVTQVDADETFDVVSGTAGSLCALLAYWKTSGDPRALEVAVRCGQHLVSSAQAQTIGMAWKAKQHARPLIGYSHGTAGIAFALFELSKTLDAAAKNDIEKYTTFVRTANAAISFERACYRAHCNTWPDFRTQEGPDSQIDSHASMVAWCHGAPGIALSRLSSDRRCMSELRRREIEVAIELTLSTPLMNNYSLCHGELGNALIVHNAAQALDRNDWLDRLAPRLTNVMYNVGMRRFPSGVAGQHETPGLMTGLAGIGMAFMRLAQPDRVPNVLNLSPPIAASR